MRQVPIGVRSPLLLTGKVRQESLDRLVNDLVPDLQSRIGDARVINVNTTDAGGGVAEMLHVLLPLACGAGINASWLVMEGDPDFFDITKRLHHRLHGKPGDGKALGPAELRHFLATTERNVNDVLSRVRPGDFVILHDPQTAGLAQPLQEAGIPVVWRCHIGVDVHNEHTADGWSFLQQMLEGHVDQYVFTREQYAPWWVPGDRLNIIHPAIDPLAVKNRDMTQPMIMAVLNHAGLLAGDAGVAASYLDIDGGEHPFDLTAEMITEGAPNYTDPLAIQVSRWDPLKDMVGVMQGFAEQADHSRDAHLMLVGPTAVADDPESGFVLDTVKQAWGDLPTHVRRRVHLAVLPMADPVQNAATVNAIQRHSRVVIQKSLAEGFGLTVTEAMYKGRAVIASDVGGIRDQIVEGVNGRLLPDPTDLDHFAKVLADELGSAAEASRLGAAAHETVVEKFLPDTSLSRWYGVVRRLASGH